VPIVVTTPVQGDAVGPGTFIRASTQSVLPVGHHWDSLIYQPGTQDELSGSISFVEGQSNEQILNVRQVQPGQREAIWMPQLAQPATGAEFDLHVRVVSAQSEILDTSGPIGVVWRPDPAGVAYVQSLGQTQGGGTTGGFTEADRAELQVVKASVTADFGEGIIRGIGQLLTNLPPSLFGKTPIPPPRTGSGRLSNPVGPVNTAAAGLAWVVTDRKLGLGIDEGAPDRVELDILEVRYIDRLADATEYTSQHLQSAELSGAWIWGFAPPYALEYWIIPGVTIQFYWLQPGFPPNWQTDEAGARQIMRDWRP
jgi:hypothetical protein